MRYCSAGKRTERTKDRTVEMTKAEDYGPMPQEERQNGTTHEEGDQVIKEEDDVGIMRKRREKSKRREGE